MKRGVFAMSLNCLMLSGVFAGCQPAAEPVPPSCGAARLGGWVGQPVAALDEQYLPQTVRLIRPGDAVTDEFQPGRLNVVLNASDLVVSFHCG